MEERFDHHISDEELVPAHVADVALSDEVKFIRERDEKVVHFLEHSGRQPPAVY